MIPPGVAGRARQIELRARKNVGGLVSGAYRSMLKGQGVEFLEVREYVPGDDTRSIDWNVTARAGRPFLKRYAEERERTVMLLVDASASNRLGSVPSWKSDIIAELFALLSLAAIYNGDDAGLILFAGDIERYVPPTRSETHVRWLIREVLTCEPRSPGTDIRRALDFFAKVQHRRSLVFLLSDFLDRGFESSLRTCAHRHDLIALPVYDPRDEQLPDCGLIEVEDPESGARLVLDSSDPPVRTAYEAAARRSAGQLRQTLESAGADTLRIAAGSDYFPRLLRFLRAGVHRASSFAMLLFCLACLHAQDIRDKLDPVPLTSPSPPPWIAITAVVAAIATIAICLLALCRRPRRRDSTPADRFEPRARRRLAGLAASLPADPSIFYLQLSCIFVEYLEERLRLPVTRYTSHEVLRALANAGLASGASATAIAAFLAECDFGKFSRRPAIDPAAVDRCRVLIDTLGGRIAATPRLATPNRGFEHAAV